MPSFAYHPEHLLFQTSLTLFPSTPFLSHIYSSGLSLGIISSGKPFFSQGITQLCSFMSPVLSWDISYHTVLWLQAGLWELTELRD